MVPFTIHYRYHINTRTNHLGSIKCDHPYAINQIFAFTSTVFVPRGEKKRRSSESHARENETFFLHPISFSSYQLVARKQATVHARVQATRSSLRGVASACVPFFNHFVKSFNLLHALSRAHKRAIAVIRLTIV